MNRPIKFRAYDPKTGEMIYFEHGFAEMFGYFSNPEQMDRFPRLIWMQFTGLHDKHGKEIYEGDIVEITLHGSRVRFAITFENACFGLKGKYSHRPLWNWNTSDFILLAPNTK